MPCQHEHGRFYDAVVKGKNNGRGHGKGCAPSDPHKNKSHLGQGGIGQHTLNIVGTNGRDTSITNACNSQDSQKRLDQFCIIDKNQGCHAYKPIGPKFNNHRGKHGAHRCGSCRMKIRLPEMKGESCAFNHECCK